MTLPGGRALFTANFYVSSSFGADTVCSSGLKNSGFKLDQPWSNCMIPWDEYIASI